MVEGFSLNCINLELKTIIPEIFQSIRLFFLQIVDDLSETLLSDLLD
jgi:hypothetical protein